MRTPIHPGEILADELEEIGISAAELARLIEVPANRVSQIISREAGNHGGYGAAVSALFPHVGGFLDEPAKDL